MKISNLPLVLADESTTLPVVHNGASGRADLGQMVDASFGPLASALAVALGNYRPTIAEAVAQIAVGAMFASDETGTLCLYRRISAAPFYVLYDTVLTSGLLDKRTAQVASFAAIGAKRFDAGVTMVETAAHIANSGAGAATYVCDALATAALAAAYPYLCRQSLDGRHWRLLPTKGAISLAQAGAVANDASKAVANTLAYIQIHAYLRAVYGGGTITSPAGLLTFDRATMGDGGLLLQTLMTLCGEARGASAWVVNGAPPTIGTTTNNRAFIQASGACATIVDMDIQGIIAYSGVTRGLISRTTIRGWMSSETQYEDQAIDVASYFAAGTAYSDGTVNGGATDLVTSSAPADTLFSLSGSVLSITFGGTPGALDMRYELSDYIPLDPNEFISVDYLDGYLGGQGAVQPLFLLYDADHNPIYSGDERTKPSNNYEPSTAFQNVRWISQWMHGASYVRVAVGVGRGTSTPAGLTASFDLSKIVFRRLVNDFKIWAQAIMQMVATTIPWQSPADLGQLGIYNSSNVIVDDCEFLNIARSATVSYGSHDCQVRNSRHHFCMSGTVVSAPSNSVTVGARISNTHYDMRVKTTGGTLVDQRSFRIRAIGGENMDDFRCDDITIIGANWGMEILPNNVNRKVTLRGFDVKAAFAGISVARATVIHRDHKILLGLDGQLGLECTSESDGTGLTVDFIAEIEGCDIQWREFCGQRGVGISCTGIRNVNIKGGFIKAPILVQNLDSAHAVDGTVSIDGTDGVYGASAVHGFAGPCQARFNRLTPASTMMVDNNPAWKQYGGAKPWGGVFDIQTNGANKALHLAAEYVEVGYMPLLNIRNTGNLVANFPDIYTPIGSAGAPDYYVRLTPTNGANTLYDLSLRFAGLPSGVGTWRWCNIINGGTLGTGSIITQRDCRNAGIRLLAPDGSYATSYLRGNPLMATYITNWAPGAVAPDATVATTFTMKGLGQLDAIDVIPYWTPNYDGYALRAGWNGSDGAGRLTIDNLRTASRTPTATTILLSARKAN